MKRLIIVLINVLSCNALLHLLLVCIPSYLKSVLIYTFVILDTLHSCRSQWSRGLIRGSAAAYLLGLWVRIPPGYGCLYVLSVMCCEVEVSATN